MSSDVGDVLAGRFNRRPETWEERHCRWTVWVRADLRAELEQRAATSGASLRATLDEVLVAGLAALDGPARPAPGPPPKGRARR